MDAVRNLEVTFRSLGGGSKEKMQFLASITCCVSPGFLLRM